MLCTLFHNEVLNFDFEKRRGIVSMVRPESDKNVTSGTCVTAAERTNGQFLIDIQDDREKYIKTKNNIS